MCFRNVERFLLNIQHGILRKDGEEYIVKGVNEKDEDERHHRQKRSVGRKFHTHKHIRRRNKHLILHPNTKPGAFPLLDIIGKVYINCLSLESTFCFFHTFGHSNGSSIFNIHHRDLSMVPFKAELNSTHILVQKFWVAWKDGRLLTLGKSVKDTLSSKWVDK